MFLFSDGNDTHGNDAATLSAEVEAAVENHQMGLSSFGVGSGFDEVLMTSVASAGHGNFFFLSSTEEINILIQKALRTRFTPGESGVGGW